MPRHEQRRVIIVFSPDRTEATVTVEIWKGGERIQALVSAPVEVATDLMCLSASQLADDIFPVLF